MKLLNLGSNANVLRFDDGTEILFSYETPVAGYYNGWHFRSDKFFSKTTSKHIGTYLPNGTVADVVPQEAIESIVGLVRSPRGG